MRTYTCREIFFKVIKTDEIHVRNLMMDCCVANLRSRIDALVPELAKLSSVEPRRGRRHKWLEPSYSRVEVDCMIQYASPLFRFFSDVLNSRVFSTS
jgi:hypothetical protein